MSTRNHKPDNQGLESARDKSFITQKKRYDTQQDGTSESQETNEIGRDVPQDVNSSFDFKAGIDAPEGNTSVAQTYFNMFKCFIGIGILATPSAIK